MTIFDIPAERLTDLSDADLRELVARLCEAERELQGGHRNEVRWGGSQTAPDGGLDVVVEPVGPFSPMGPLTRSSVGIQVKAGDLEPGEITREMRPGGALRPAIAGLAAKGGAYIIASGGANCSEAMLRRREDAMRAALAVEPHGVNLHIAFLDRKALARWVSAHPSVAAWLRSRLSLLMLRGWRPHERWSSTPEGVDDTLISGDGLVFHLPGRPPIRNLKEALDAIRALVLTGKGAVRLAGLSGVGKSRIVQALFEEEGSGASLLSSQAIYADLGHDPDPAPVDMLNELIHRGKGAVLVVDNCPPATHQALARRLAECSSQVRLITVEYDVRSDRPEETDVVRVEAEGADIVEKLLRRRRPDLSSIDAHRLAGLSQGNARLGLALAEAAPEAGTLSAFEDAMLFDRLFWQREERDQELACAAEALSLVYSFDVEGEEDPDELAALGDLAGLSRQAMHRHAAKLLERGLAQARSRWRAVLPHALANRLARQALRSIPWKTIAKDFADKPRLRRSHARRLSYLHDFEEARRIVRHWMQPGGPLHKTNLDLGTLEIVCHLAPEETLSVIKGMIAAFQPDKGDFPRLDSVTRMLVSIAHSEVMFSRACDSIVDLMVATENKHAQNAAEALNALFGLYLSGTLAKTEARIATARKYLSSTEPTKQMHGVAMLRATLRTGGWASSFLSDHDARPEVCGWEPRTREEYEDWYARWFDLAAEVALDEPSSLRDGVRQAIADELGGLLQGAPSLRPRIYEAVRQLHAAKPWAEGRFALEHMLNIKRRRKEEIPEADMNEIKILLKKMESEDLEDRLRAELVKGWHGELDDGEDSAAISARRSERLTSLGRELAAAPDALHRIGREILSTQGESFYPLGLGLAQGSLDPIQTWRTISDLHLMDPAATSQSHILTGFLHHLDSVEPSAAEKIRAACRANALLRREYGLFLPRGVLSSAEFEHVVEIIGEPEAIARWLSDIVWREDRQLDDASRVRLLRVIGERRDGSALIVEALDMLGRVEKKPREPWPEELRAIGLSAIITLLESEGSTGKLDFSMSRTSIACLSGDDGSGALRVAEALVKRAKQGHGSIYDMKKTLRKLARMAPEIFLNAAFPDAADYASFNLWNTSGDDSLLSHIEPEFLIEWCARGINHDRWARVAPYIPPFILESGENEEQGEWRLSPLAHKFLNASPAPTATIEAYLSNISPMEGWSGDDAQIMTRRLAVIEALKEHPDLEVRALINRRVSEIRAWVEKVRLQEQEENRDQGQRFE